MFFNSIDDINQKFRITFWKLFLPHRIGNNFCTENTKFYDNQGFCVLGGGSSIF